MAGSSVTGASVSAGPSSSGTPVARSACLGGGRLHRQAVHQVVHGIAGVALDPPEGDVLALRHQLDERLPQVAVGHRLALGVHPALLDPPFPPAVPEAVDHVGGVAHHLEPAGQRHHRLVGGVDLHALVGGVLGRARGVRSALDRPGPPAGAGVPAAGPIGVDDRRHLQKLPAGIEPTCR